jgi:hypothetical protein
MVFSIIGGMPSGMQLAGDADYGKCRSADGLGGGKVAKSLSH